MRIGWRKVELLIQNKKIYFLFKYSLISSAYFILSSSDKRYLLAKYDGKPSIEIIDIQKYLENGIDEIKK